MIYFILGMVFVFMLPGLVGLYAMTVESVSWLVTELQYRAHKKALKELRSK